MISPRRVAIWALGPIFLYLGLAVVGALIPALRDDVGPPGDDHWIVLVQGPIHYDILLPLDDDTRAAFGFVRDAGVPIGEFNAAWLSIGWGSEAFYTTAGSYADISVTAVARAVTGDAAVMRFELYGPLPNHPALHRIPISRFQLDALRENIAGQVTGPALPIDGFSDTDAFFPGSGRFSLLRTCNVWVGDMLSQAGLDFGIWTPTPYAVRLSLWWNGLVPD